MQSTSEQRSKPAIYEMHKLQVSVLRKMAAETMGVFTLIEPLESDTPAFAREWKLAQDMIELGLVADIAEQLTEKEKTRIAEIVPVGRKYIVLSITQAGRLMFEYCDDPECTVHKLGDPMRRYPC